MTIETKLNINEVGYFMMHNQICSAIIIGIQIRVGVEERTTYIIDKNPKGSNYTCHFLEHDIYGTKEELLQSL